MVSGFRTGDLNPIWTAPMLGTHKAEHRTPDPPPVPVAMTDTTSTRSRSRAPGQGSGVL